MAEPITTAMLLAEETEVQFPWFDVDVAWRVGSLLRQQAFEGSMPVAIEVAMSGHRLFFCTMRGASPDNAGWVRRKRATG